MCIDNVHVTRARLVRMSDERERAFSHSLYEFPPADPLTKTRMESTLHNLTDFACAHDWL
jgi:hypothetical protein